MYSRNSSSGSSASSGILHFGSSSSRLKESSSSSRVGASGGNPFEIPVKRLKEIPDEIAKTWERERDTESERADPQLQNIVDMFKVLANVTEIDLVAKDLGDVRIRVIGRVMQEVPFPFLRRLELGGNDMSTRGIEPTAEAIKAGHLPKLESLGLCTPRPPGQRYNFVAWTRNEISDEGLEMLAGAFASGHSRNLKVLNLEFNRIGHLGAAALAKAIRGGHLPSLEVLNLSFTSVGDEGTVALAKALEESGTSHLKMLDLEHCHIEERGLKALASALDSGNFMELMSINLAANNVKSGPSGVSWRTPRPRDPFSPFDEGLIELAKVLQNGHLPGLQTLDLTGNAGGKKSAEAFLQALRNNKTLIVELKIDWPSFSGLANSASRQAINNRKYSLLLRQLRGEEDVQATNGKIFLCGDPREGKTTLRKSLQNKISILKIERTLSLHEEPPTRGIEVSYIVSRGERGEPPVTVALWDLAGQTEYQILHSAFLPDLAFADGLATTFVVVTNAKHSHRSTEALNYWMRFIASSSFKGADGGRRHVLLVLNLFNNEPCEHIAYWTSYLEELHSKFQDYLEIETRPFVMDVRVARSVKPLKDHLMVITRDRLRDKKVPKITHYIQSSILVPARAMEFPVMSWPLFVSQLQSLVPDEVKLKAAAEYLHESGHLIHFPEGSLVEGGDPLKSLVVMNPDWICRKVVGYLLLPERLRVKNETALKERLSPDNSLALTDLYTHFNHLLHHNHQVQDIVAILFRLGICYKVGIDKVLIPALIEGAENPTGCWGQSGFQGVSDQWVMGYCLKVEYKETTLLPVAVFRKLQVALAQDRFGSNADSEYTVGKMYLHFKYSGMAVLVELSEHDQQDRVDILVKPIVNREQDRSKAKKRREQQVDLAQLILERFLSLAEIWSPGVEFVQAVVKPWSTAMNNLTAPNRFVNMSVAELKQRVQDDGIEALTSWTVGTDPAELVSAIDLLSGTQLRDWRNAVERQCVQVEHVIVKLGLVPENRGIVSEHSGELPELPSSELSEQVDSSKEMRELFKVLYKFGKRIDERLGRVSEQLDHVSLHVDELMVSMQGVREDLGLALGQQKKILDSIQALQRFSVQEKERSVPRFMYLSQSRDMSGIWMKIRDLFYENSATLHFLCEADFNSHCVHEVVDQEGIEIRDLKKWVPWAQWSLKVAIVVAKVALNVVCPGLSQLFQGFPSGEQQEADLDLAIAYWCTATVAQAETVSNGFKHASKFGMSAPSNPVEVKNELKMMLRELLGGELSDEKLLRAFKLRRVVLNNSGYVVWICDNCCQQYNRMGSVQLLS